MLLLYPAALQGGHMGELSMWLSLGSPGGAGCATSNTTDGPHKGGMVGPEPCEAPLGQSTGLTHPKIVDTLSEKCPITTLRAGTVGTAGFVQKEKQWQTRAAHSITAVVWEGVQGVLNPRWEHRAFAEGHSSKSGQPHGWPGTCTHVCDAQGSLRMCLVRLHCPGEGGCGARRTRRSRGE